MSIDRLAPGNYTLQWLVDVRSVSGMNPLRVAQVVAYSLSPRFGELVGNPPQPTDAEAVVNRTTDDVLTGVVRLRVTRAVENVRDMDAAIIAALRANGYPNATGHVSASSVAPVAALPIVAPLALLGGAAALLVRQSDSGRDALASRFGRVIQTAEPRIDNTIRPLMSSSPVGAVLAVGSNRVSADPARNGSIGVAAARDGANAVGEALTLSPGAIAAIVAGSAAVCAIVGFVLYKKVVG